MWILNGHPAMHFGTTSSKSYLPFSMNMTIESMNEVLYGKGSIVLAPDVQY